MFFKKKKTNVFGLKMKFGQHTSFRAIFSMFSAMVVEIVLLFYILN